MDLIQAKKILEEKDRKKNKLLGQKEMLLVNLKKLGYDSIEIAQKTAKELKLKVEKMKVHYEKGEEKFKEDYGYLLE